MAVLASRRHYCTNKNVCSKDNLDEECKNLLKDEDKICPDFKNVHKIKSHASLQKGGCHEVHDIEDLVKVGMAVKGCPYFAAQALAEEAQLVFCPYNYIIHPIVRRAMDINIKGSIIILDEAHNIEDMARDAGSVNIEEEVLYTLQKELGQLSVNGSVAMIYQPLYDMIQGIISWIGDRKNNLRKCGFEHYSSYWTGDNAMKELEQAGITQQCFPVFQECATKAFKSASDSEVDEAHLSGVSAITLEGLCSSLSFFFSGNGCHAVDYQLALQRYVKRDGDSSGKVWRCSMNLWCLNPGVVFKEIADSSFSVILTSGTLSPMGSFTSELGVQFEACMEAPHVIDVKSQLWAAVIPSGPGNCQLNASYKTADGYAFQDELGTTIEEICKIVPGGALVFFPSYKLLEKLHVRWCQTGLWKRLNAQKPVFIEPRGSVKDFEPIFKGYCETINGTLEIPCGRPKGGRKDSKKYIPRTQNRVNKGAALLAVCRGKVSEGIDFADDIARVVVIVGIPFPNKNDIQVELKRKYNDAYKLSKGLLSGSDWYCHQAFRALNQAAGRCIRHRFDYGAVILLDERFNEERNIAYISKWLKKSIKKYENFDDSLMSLQKFFLDAEKKFNKNGLGIRLNEFSINNKIKSCTQNKDQKKACCSWEKVKSHQPFGILEESDSTGIEPILGPNYIDLENSLLPSRYRETSSPKFFENSIINGNHETQSTCGSVDKFTCTYSNTVVETANLFPERPPLSSPSVIDLTVDQSEITHISNEVSGKQLQVSLCNPEMELPLNASVNSHPQKRRKLEISQFSSHSQISQLCSSEQKTSKKNLVSSHPWADILLAKYDLSCEHQNPGQGFIEKNFGRFPSPYLSIHKDLPICCYSCKSSLGLRKNNFFVKCLLTSSSKIFVSHVLNNGPDTSVSLTSPEFPQKNSHQNIPVIICDIVSIDQQYVKEFTSNPVLHRDTWSDQDGCVFRVFSCPYCSSSKSCLGLQIMAADSANTDLLNKVMFNTKHLDVQDGTPIGLNSQLDCTEIPEDSVPVVQDVRIQQMNDSAWFNAKKSKLSLPK